ncbi:MAG: DUF1549 and DUF1553 domain-containing protein, partial [Pirellulales bacterium]
TPEPSSFWSFQPLRRPAVPAVVDTPAVRNPIDAFVTAQLESRNLRIAPEASKEQLIRRAYFDLTGLPPTPPEIIDFLVDTDAGAYERMIDRLLASPHYGERWGQHWLDAIGYADSHGKIDRDQFRPYMWRYRDYVIQSLNEDKPYDRFLTEQIAGDELLEAEPQIDKQRGVEDLVATGFWLMAADATDEAAFNFVPQRMGVVAEQIDIFSSAVMGLSMECARCHNHKFDPISQSDYYRFSAILQSALDPYDWRLSSRLLYPRKSPIDRVFQRYLYVDEGPESPTLSRHNAPLRKRLEELRTDLENETKHARSLLPQDAAAFGEPLSADELAAKLPEFKAKRDPLVNEIAGIQVRILEPGVIAGLRDMGGEPTPVYLLRRGDPLATGVRVEPDVPRALQPTAGPYHVEPPAPGSQSSGNRLALAHWLTNPHHPLTARVFVNRVWQQHFGQGIVSTPGNFGEMGARPTHPELLDWLASEFVASGWSLKHLHRLIMNSSTYRQSSQVGEEQLAQDADNRWLSRYPLRRLDGESVRDATLAVSGQLDAALFGPPTEVERTPEGEVIEANPQPLRRRSIYLAKMRMKPLTLIEQFDGPELVPNCLVRTHSTVATQALQLYNGPFVRESAAALASRLVAERGKSDAEHVEFLYLAVFGRRPTAAETTAATKWLAQLRTAWQRNAAATDPAAAPSADEAAWTSYCHVLLNSPEFLYLD